MLALKFQIGNDRVALDIRRILEVVPRVKLDVPIGSPHWLAGVFVWRGAVVPVVDLHRLAGAGDCPLHLSSRIILVSSDGVAGGRPFGLLAAQVAEVGEVEPPAGARSVTMTVEAADLGPLTTDAGRLIRLLDLDRLLPDLARQRLGGSAEGPK